MADKESSTDDLDPTKVLSELAEEALSRLGTRFKVTVKGSYADFPLTLTVTVEEYEEEEERGET